MRIKMLVPGLLAATVTAMAAVPAHASDDDCRHVPRTEWRSMEDAAAAVKAKGYEVREIEIDDGCFEVKVLGKSGERMKLYLDPGSLEIVRSRNRS